ncbi:hypothetical protein AAFF_G00349790 [Aldrovandia affinis]|uniref:Uncharacterized protein n=1 Tax=Aldrovandia affinis TaxID=143900 RepID=A0AAD7SJX4_9TELE|nr:hypothetical protein AAFF_G00349790 [Aldrovandia affinis]
MKPEEGEAGLDTRCSALLSDLGRRPAQVAQWRQEESGIHSKVKACDAGVPPVSDLAERAHMQKTTPLTPSPS